MASIFDFVNNREIAQFWSELTQDREPFPLQALWPDRQKLGLDLKWLKGSKGLPVTLSTSAYDAASIPRPRMGFERLTTQMPYFKESKYIDEELRQELNMVLETGNQTYIEAVISRVFDDQTELLEAASSAREMMRAMVLTSGVISIAGANGQAFDYDYGVPAAHKGNAAVKWTSYATADPMEDIRVAVQKVLDDTGVTMTRGIVSGKTWRDLRNCEMVRKGIFVASAVTGVTSAVPNDAAVRAYVLQEVGITLAVHDKRYSYKDSTGNLIQTKYIPDDTLTLFPEGSLGNTWFGTTPAQSDLMGSGVANVSIVDTGVAIVTAKKVDPVQVETIVSQISLPDFPMADKIYIMDTNP